MQFVESKILEMDPSAPGFVSSWIVPERNIQSTTCSLCVVCLTVWFRGKRLNIQRARHRRTACTHAHTLMHSNFRALYCVRFSLRDGGASVSEMSYVQVHNNKNGDKPSATIACGILRCLDAAEHAIAKCTTYCA